MGLDALILGAFAVTYLGMALGRLPWLRIDRTGIALVAATVLVGSNAIAAPQALAAIDFPTLFVLFGLMILSAQLAEAGVYEWCADRIASVAWSPCAVLAGVVAVSGGLAAIVSNDVVVFAMAPMLCLGVARRGWDPRPFVLALAGGANAGSAATAIGNPQNILIAQAGTLRFAEFSAVCAPPALAALGIVWAVLAWQWRGRWLQQVETAAVAERASLDRAMTFKAGVALLALVVLLNSPLPQAMSCTLVAAALLISRRLSSHRALAMVDWHLLVLFASLFIVTAAIGQTPLPQQALGWLERAGGDLSSLPGLAFVALIGSNTIGNVPADMMLLALMPQASPQWLYGLAVFSTLAGNLLLTGSMANVIAVERAASCGVRVSFREHARGGIPMTALSLAVALGWFWLWW